MKIVLHIMPSATSTNFDMTVPEVSQDTLWYDRIVDILIKKESHECSKLATSFKETTETTLKTSSDEAGQSTP